MVCIYFKDQSLFSENSSFFHIILKLRYYIKHIHFFVSFSVAYISNKHIEVNKNNFKKEQWLYSQYISLERENATVLGKRMVNTV